MASNEVPQAVLADRLTELINGRKVRAAVFTTFCFDPGFFELHVLPTLFDISFSQVEKVKRIQLDDALRSVEHIAVYYDRTALAQDALPAQLDFARIGVRGPHGVFHPKLVLILVENPVEDQSEDDGDKSAGRWVDCGESASAMVRELLPSTSFLQVVHAKGSWRVLVREERVLCRPSLLATLTPEEILMYWSLLSEAQKEAFILEKLSVEGQLQGLTVRSNRYAAQNTIFDRFAGIYHAFEQLYRHVTECLARGELRDAEARLFGAKYDSLPELLRKTLDENQDPVMRYIMFLCAKQICERVRRFDGTFWSAHRDDRKRLDDLLAHLPQLAQDLPLDEAERSEFLEWYESMFVRMIRQPEAVA